MSAKIVGERCKRCGHEWVPHTGSNLIKCPHCHSPYWNIEPKQEKVKS